MKHGKNSRESCTLPATIMVLLAGFYFTSSFSGSNDKELKDNFKQGMLRQVPQGNSLSASIAAGG